MITIITPVYNNVSTIERTIKSVLEQKKTANVEYIIVDGLSTDGTMEIVNRYRNQIDIIISEKDKGIGDAYNKGINLASGELIGIVAADDMLVPGVLKNVDKLYDEKSDVVVGNCLIDIDPNSDRLRIWEISHELDYLKYYMFLPHPSMLIRKSAYEKYGKYCIQYKAAMDHELALRYYMMGATFQFVDLYINVFSGYGGISTSQVELAKKEDLEIALQYGVLEDDWNRVRNSNSMSDSVKGKIRQFILNIMPNKLKNYLAIKSGKHLMKKDIDYMY